jgi:micrococcal nuclease
MTGTKIVGVKLINVIDGDTIKIHLNGKVENVRMACLDTEESQEGSSKPVTQAGKLASKWARHLFGADEATGAVTGDVTVDIEFDSIDPEATCVIKHRDNYGRLLGYVYKNGENICLKTVSEGHSAYFIKYGRSRLYHAKFVEAERHAQCEGSGVWDPNVNARGNTRDYAQLLPWWHMRDSIVQEYRANGVDAGVLSVQLDYEALKEGALSRKDVTVFCDLQAGINKWVSGGAVIYAGTPQSQFNLWVPDVETPEAQRILRLIKTRYAGEGRGYVYVRGKAAMYGPASRPEMVLENSGQFSDACPMS